MITNPAHEIAAPGPHDDAAPAVVPSANEARTEARTAESGRVRRLSRPVTGLVAAVLFQALFLSTFLGVLDRPAVHDATVAVVGTSPVAGVVSRPGGGMVSLISEPSAQAARAAVHGGQAYAAIVAGPHAETLYIETAASPGTAAALTKGFTAAAAALKMPLQVHDLAPLPASDPTGVSAFFLVAAWVLGGYLGATVLGLMTGGVRSRSLRLSTLRIGLIAGYAAASGVAGAALFGPGLGITSTFSVALAGLGLLVVFAAAAATAAPAAQGQPS